MYVADAVCWCTKPVDCVRVKFFASSHVPETRPVCQQGLPLPGQRLQPCILWPLQFEEAWEDQTWTQKENWTHCIMGEYGTGISRPHLAAVTAWTTRNAEFSSHWKCGIAAYPAATLQPLPEQVFQVHRRGMSLLLLRPLQLEEAWEA